MKYAARFQVDLADDIVYLDSLENMANMEIIIGSEHADEFWPIAFCRNDVMTISLTREQDGEFIQEDLIELAAYCNSCNGGSK